MLRITKQADYALVLLSQFASAELGYAQPPGGQAPSGPPSGGPSESGRAARPAGAAKAPADGRTVLAEAPVRTARELSEKASLPLPTVSKILKALSRSGLLASLRGVNGGYRLARPAHEISVADVISAIDGPISFTDCLTDPAHSISGKPGALAKSGLSGKAADERAADAKPCLLEPSCPTRTHWVRINRVVAEALTKLPLSEVARPVGLVGLERIESLRPDPGSGAEPHPAARSLANGVTPPEGPSR